MQITIETIQHENQRYNTCGDWVFVEPNHLRIRVSELGDWRKEMAVAVHELVEAALCHADGISSIEVDAFDMAYEKARVASPTFGKDLAEPGDDPAAPHHRQHCFATAVERMLIAALGVPWAEHTDAVETLP